MRKFTKLTLTSLTVMLSSQAFSQRCDCELVLKNGVYNYFEGKYEKIDYHNIQKEIFLTNKVISSGENEPKTYVVFDENYTESQFKLLQKLTRGRKDLNEEEKNVLLTKGAEMLCSNTREAYSICTELCKEE